MVFGNKTKLNKEFLNKNMIFFIYFLILHKKEEKKDDRK